ncbi:MAG TPA: type VI secretion system tip protein TssI/VgrG [Gemmataceae bacterium]|jgi:type VI secretion system secreted protein VgrG
MPATFTQADSPMKLTTPLGADALLLTGFGVNEGISQLFHAQLDVVATNDQDVPFDKLLGQRATVEVAVGSGKSRFFSGIVVRVAQGGRDQTFTGYRLELAPQCWLLTRRWQSRIFQHVSVPDILKKVLAGLDVAFEIQGTLPPRDYCVQYRESDFNFASRLMEEEGIYYFFKHTKAGHKMVVANTPQSHPELPEQSKVIFEGVFGGSRDEMRVVSWGKVQELRSGKYTLWDHSFELPHKRLEAEKPIADSVQVGQVTHKLKFGDNGKLEIYDYPGEYAQRFDGVDKGGGDKAADLQKIFDDNKRTAAIRMEQEAVPGLVIQGTGYCRHFASGHKFTLERHFNADGPYLITGVTHVARSSNYLSSDGAAFQYSNSFTCIPFAQPFRPQRTSLKPFVQGTQTAVVVGPKGQETFTDKYGRVKVQFHWDREGKRDADSSCWVRVAQFWAGKRWGASFTPRIGQEVIVAFQEGDPDQPIVIGSVYNADQMPPYLGDGPDARHKNDPKVSGVKSNTTPGGGGFNEWRFDDTKGNEQVFVHAQRDYDLRVNNDRREAAQNAHLIVGCQDKDGKKSGDQKEEVYRNKHLKVHKDQEEHIGGDMKLHVGGVDGGKGNADVLINGKKTETIGGEYHLRVKGEVFEQVDNFYNLTLKNERFVTAEGNDILHIKLDRAVKVDASDNLQVGANQLAKIGGRCAADVGQEIHFKAGQTVVIEAGTQLTLKVGGNFIDINSGGVFIKGAAVAINSGGSPATGAGADPTGPQEAEPPSDAAEAEPAKPDAPDDALSGQKSSP